MCFFPLFLPMNHSINVTFKFKRFEAINFYISLKCHLTTLHKISILQKDRVEQEFLLVLCFFVQRFSTSSSFPSELVLCLSTPQKEPPNSQNIRIGKERALPTKWASQCLLGTCLSDSVVLDPSIIMMNRRNPTPASVNLQFC